MTTAVDAIYEAGVFKPEKPVDLKDKTKVRLVIESAPERAADDDPTGWKAARRFIGMWKDGSPGESVGEDHDKYLYRRT